MPSFQLHTGSILAHILISAVSYFIAPVSFMIQDAIPFFVSTLPTHLSAFVISLSCIWLSFTSLKRILLPSSTLLMMPYCICKIPYSFGFIILPWLCYTALSLFWNVAFASFPILSVKMPSILWSLENLTSYTKL